MSESNIDVCVRLPPTFSSPALADGGFVSLCSIRDSVKRPLLFLDGIRNSHVTTWSKYETLVGRLAGNFLTVTTTTFHRRCGVKGLI
jgi:hypothetical protein